MRLVKLVIQLQLIVSNVKIPLKQPLIADKHPLNVKGSTEKVLNVLVKLVSLIMDKLKTVLVKPHNNIIINYNNNIHI